MCGSKQGRVTPSQGRSARLPRPSLHYRSLRGVRVGGVCWWEGGEIIKWDFNVAEIGTDEDNSAMTQKVMVWPEEGSVYLPWTSNPLDRNLGERFACVVQAIIGAGDTGGKDNHRGDPAAAGSIPERGQSSHIVCQWTRNCAGK